MRIGLLTDTHLPGEVKELWPEVRKAFAGCDLILHGGDIVTQGVLDWLEQIAPVLAAKGNNDWDWGDARVKPIHFLDVEGWRLGMVHDMEPEDRPIDYLCKQYLKGERVDIMVTGHTHFERLVHRDGVVQLNSGSPIHPRLWSTRLGTVGILDITRSRIEATVVKLGEMPGLKNPGQNLSVVVRS